MKKKMSGPEGAIFPAPFTQLAKSFTNDEAIKTHPYIHNRTPEGFFENPS